MFNGLSRMNENTNNFNTSLKNSPQAQEGIAIGKCQGGESSQLTQAISSMLGGNIVDIFRISLGSQGDYNRELDILNHAIKGNQDSLDRLEESKLYNRWKQSYMDQELAMIKTIVAARNYYKNKDKDEGLTTFLTKFVNPEIDKDISNNINQINLFHNVMSNNYSKLINTYNDISGVTDIIVNLVESKEKKLVEEINKVKLYEKEYNVDIRKNLYQYETITLYDNIFNILKIIYYSIFVIYIIFGNFAKLQLYKNVLFYIFAIIYLILPFILKYIFAGIIYIYELILNIFGIHKEIYSYSDIMRATILDNIYTSPVPSQVDANQIETTYNNTIANKYN